MTRYRRRLRGPVVSACSALLLMVTAVATANASPGDQNPSQGTSAQAPPSRDFLLGRPRASIGVRGNWLFARAGSDIYDFVTEQLTFEKAAFNAPTVGGELGINLTPRIDLVVGFDFAKSATGSEYRKFIDNRGLPIEQNTSLRTFNVMASAKAALTPRGRRISRFAWIPRGVTPYVGAGAGLVNYEFQQYGDFVDYKDSHVFSGTFSSKGWAPSAHAFGGADLQVYKRLFMSLEGRYIWGSSPLDQDFIDFDPIDLSGFRFGAGFHVVF